MPAPEYERFEEEARQEVAAQQALIGRWQAEAKALLEGDTPVDVDALWPGALKK